MSSKIPVRLSEKEAGSARQYPAWNAPPGEPRRDWQRAWVRRGALLILPPLLELFHHRQQSERGGQWGRLPWCHTSGCPWKYDPMPWPTKNGQTWKPPCSATELRGQRGHREGVWPNHHLCQPWVLPSHWYRQQHHPAPIPSTGSPLCACSKRQQPSELAPVSHC